MPQESFCASAENDLSVSKFVLQADRENKTQYLRGFQRHRFFHKQKQEAVQLKNTTRKNAEPELNPAAKIFLFLEVEMAKLRSFFDCIFMPTNCRFNVVICQFGKSVSLQAAKNRVVEPAIHRA